MFEKLRILHLEDYASDAELIGNVLKKGIPAFERLVVDAREEYVMALKGFKPDVILSDHSLPSFNSYDALSLLQESGMKIPFILVTATISEEFAVDVIKRGADDYILKDRLKRLPAAIKNSLEKYRLEKERQIFLGELIKAENRFRALVENSTDAVVILNRSGTPTYVSPSIQRVLGYTEAEAMKLNLFEQIYIEDREGVSQKMAECLQKPGLPLYGAPARVKHKNGQWIWLEATITNMLHEPSINGIVDNFKDVTEKKLAEEKLVHANRLYAFISQVNQTIVHVKDEHVLFDEICRIAIEHGKFKMAWIGIVDKAGGKINLVSSCGAHADDVVLFTDYTYDARGPIEKITQGRNTYIVLDISKDLGPKLEKHLAQRGFNSGICLAIKKSAEVVGVFSIYSSDTDFFNKEEIGLLKEATGDISFALDVFEKDKEKLLAEKKLKDSQQRLLQAGAIAHLGSWEEDFCTGTELWSDEALKIYGLSPGDNERPNESWLSFIHPDDVDHVLKVTREAAATLSNAAFFHRIVRHDGTTRHIYSQSQYQFNNAGQAVGRYGVAHDITDMREAKEALRNSESNLQAIFNNTSEGFILADKNGILQLFNNKAKEYILLNVEKEVAPGESIFDFIAENRKENYRNKISKVLAGETIQYDYFYERKNGKKTWFNFTLNPVCNAGIIDAVCITAADITERKRIENSFIESELRYRQIVETAQEGIWVIDAESSTTFVNKKMCDILGYAREEMLGKDIFYFRDEPGKKIAKKSIEERKKGLGTTFDERFITKKGKYIWARVSANPILDIDGNYNGALAMVSDITEQKKLEDLLDKANQLARMGSWEVDVAKDTLYWSAVTKEIHEVPNDFLPVLNPAIDFYKAGPSRDAINAAMLAAMEENIPFDLELQLVTAKSNELWVRAIGEAEWVNGKCTKVFGSFQDIDKRKSAEAELLGAYEDKRVILESIGDGFYALDKNWIITYWNKEAETLLGKKRENVIGENIWNIYPEAVDTVTYTNYCNAVKYNTVQHYESFNETLNQWAEVSAYPSPNGLSVYFKDITGRKQIEMERANMITDIIQRNKDLEQFSYIISHNLRAPVANIIGLTGELKRSKHDAGETSLLNNYLDVSVKQLDSVIADLNGILEVKKEISERKEPVVFSELVEDIRSSIQYLTRKENVKIRVDFSQSDKLVTIKSYLYSIFYNLISNSIKYRRQGVPLSIKVKSELVEGKVTISFKDNGSGIDLVKNSAQVFGLYKRFHRDVEGKGMGLFMVKTQVELLGGKISVSSEVNRGTEFKIELQAN